MTKEITTSHSDTHFITTYLISLIGTIITAALVPLMHQLILSTPPSDQYTLELVGREWIGGGDVHMLGSLQEGLIGAS
jgi:hypothetical protein